ncbi:MAG: hypothetical protein ACQESE_04280 [Nanobdellota archaeon]
MESYENILEAIDGSSAVMFPEATLQKIFMTIYLAEEPISLKRIAELTNLCLASVSNKAKEMVHAGIIQKYSKPGSRELFLYTKHSLTEVMSIHIQQKINVMKRHYEELKEMEAELEERSEEKKKLKEMRKEVKSILDAHKHMNKELGERN